MHLISRYLLRNLILGMIFVAGVLTFAILLTQSLRFLELAVNGGAPVRLFLTLIGLTMPGFLAVVLPIATFVVILFVYNKLAADSELVVMRAAGLSHWKLALPGVAVGLAVSVVVLAINAWLAPMANRELRELKQMVKSDYSSLLLREGVFNNLSGGITVYVRERTRDGELHGMLIHDGQNPAKPITIAAKRGRLQSSPEGPRVLVFDGSRQEFNAQTGQIAQLEFDRYVVDLRTLESGNPERWREPSERSLVELLRPSNSSDLTYASAFAAEAHTRIATAFLALGFGIIALGALLVGEFSRRGQMKRVLFAVLAVVAVQGASLALSNLARISPSVIPLIYVVTMAPIMTAGLALVLGVDQRRRRNRTAAVPA